MIPFIHRKDTYTLATVLLQLGVQLKAVSAGFSDYHDPWFDVKADKDGNITEIELTRDKTFRVPDATKNLNKLKSLRREPTEEEEDCDISNESISNVHPLLGGGMGLLQSQMSNHGLLRTTSHNSSSSS
ncbi:MAG: hypothetical protein SGARI_006969 [Bacillariaceae sp.]